MRKKIILYLLSLFTISSLYSQGASECSLKDTITKTRDYVPDEVTAKKIAEAIWLPIYGEKILKQSPYKATLVNDIWIVEGLVPEPYRNEPNYRGGTAHIEIRKSDCKILKVTHGR